MNSLKLNEKDLAFADKARYASEIADHIGITYPTLKAWLLDIPITKNEKQRLFTPQQVRIILEHVK